MLLLSVARPKYSTWLICARSIDIDKARRKRTSRNNCFQTGSATFRFGSTYDPPVQREHLAALAIQKLEEVEILSIVSLSGGTIFLNLAAPLLINGVTRRGLQVVSDDPRYSTKAAIPALEKPAPEKNEAAAQSGAEKRAPASAGKTVAPAP